MYYAINGQRQGPIAPVEFERLVSTGVITDQTLVWKDGMADWKPYGEVKASLPPTLPAGAAASASGSFTTGPSGTAEETAVCAVSGKTFPKREMIQYEGKWAPSIATNFFSASGKVWRRSKRCATRASGSVLSRS